MRSNLKFFGLKTLYRRLIVRCPPIAVAICNCVFPFLDQNGATPGIFILQHIQFLHPVGSEVAIVLAGFALRHHISNGIQVGNHQGPDDAVAVTVLLVLVFKLQLQPVSDRPSQSRTVKLLAHI